MKWVKHMSDTIDNPRIQELLDKYGAQGYFWYFGIIEFLAREDALNEPSETSLAYLARKLRTKPRQLLDFLRSNDDLLTHKYNPETERVSLFCQKMQLIRDNYTKDLQGSCKTLATNLPKEKEKDKEIDKDTEKDKKLYPDFEIFMKKWNASGFIKISKLTSSRKEKLRARLLDEDFDFDKIIKAMQTAQNDFMYNYFTFDWVTANNKNWVKVIEGNYNKGNKAISDGEQKFRDMVKRAGVANK